MAITTSKYVPGVEGEAGTSVAVTVGAGTTVAVESQYIYDGDSSYWGVYFDFETGEFAQQGTGYTPQGITVDATPEIMSAWEAAKVAKKAAQQASAMRSCLVQAKREAEYEAATPRPGKTLKVVAGRKVPKGTVGECFYYGEGQWGYRVGMMVEGEKVWTAASNVEVVAKEMVSA